MKAGIIDPTKVTRFALQNAASVAALLLTTEAMIAEKPKEKEEMPHMPPGGGMGWNDVIKRIAFHSFLGLELCSRPFFLIRSR